MSLEAISISPNNGNPAQYLLVALHGWGANYRDLVPLAPMFGLANCQFLFPNAPFPHPYSSEGRAWYDIENPQFPGLQESRELLFDWMQALEANTGIPLERTFMVGFSQGGAMTLDIGLQLPLAGLCSLSGYLHFQPQPIEIDFPPVLIIHGIQDQVVPIQAARKAKEELSAIGVSVTYQEFNMGHEIPPESLEVIQAFLSDRSAG